MNAFKKSRPFVQIVLIITLLSSLLWNNNLVALADGLDEGEGSSDFIEETIDTDVTDDIISEDISDDFIVELDGEECNPEEMLSDYIDFMVDNEFTDEIPSYAASSICGDKLDGINRKIYNQAKVMAAEVAAGKRDSSKFVVELDPAEQKHFVKGKDFNTSNDLAKCYGMELRPIMLSIFYDCPYERYWMGLRVSYNFNYKWSGDEYWITKFTLIFQPNTDYALNGQIVTTNANGKEILADAIDVNKTAAVKNTIKEVNNILSAVKDKNDREKIDYYKERIIDLNEYNHEALQLPTSKYGNPWQLVWVFDNDPSTNVVCEGYSKAFMYLCEKTDFEDSSINCYVVTGDLVNSGAHMWNIVHWSDNTNYLVDITNCDGGHSKTDLFMATPISGSPTDKYTYKLSTVGSGQISYKYDEDTMNTHTIEELTIGQASAAELTDLQIDYNSDIKAYEPVQFTVKRIGGSNNTQFRLDAVKDCYGNPVYTSTDYTAQNIFSYKFEGEGTYTLTFSAKDGEKTVEGKTIEVNVKKGISDEQYAQIRAFVERFYLEILHRASDEEGLDNWTEALASGKMTGADVAKGVALSKELENQNINNADFVNRMYAGFFDRAADQDGFDLWIDNLYAGCTRYYVVQGFVNSTEFKKLCEKYGINPGSLEKKGGPTKPLSYPQLKLDSSKVKDEDIERYVDRLYDKVLHRAPDADGRAMWIKVLKEGKGPDGKIYDAATVASVGFFTSKEYKDKNKTNAEFVYDAYLAFFDRDPLEENDPGYEFWIDQLDTGKMSRKMMIERGFGQSDEFKKLLRSFGYEIK